ncbi:C-type lectin domain family 1 member A-like [Chrysemys picta bellii]|uniref:C-type lectin domain family 1 member A-like n=1 Tax=Chrysemys picta bellii TaxID=8478 RepID=UPI0032B1B691
MCLSVKGIYLPGRSSSGLAMENEDGCTTIKFYSQTPASAFRSPECPSPSPQWWLIAVILEILCLALLITARVFDANSSQLSCLEAREYDNLTQQRENLKNLTQQLECLQAQNLNLSEAVQQLASYRGSKCRLCPDKWLQHGEDCFHFSNEFKIWQKSKDYCSSLASKLLQIDSKEELDFIMQELFKLSNVCQGLRYHENYWFGLSYDTAIKKWVWEDGTTLSSHL